MKEKLTAADLTIVICAYKECEELERCIRSIIRQTQKAKLIISTSTPNDFISGYAARYHIPVYVNPEGGHVKDYNFALSLVRTKLGMIAHQDDLLHPRFVEESIRALNRASDPILSFTDYAEMHNDMIDRHPSTLIRIKRFLVWPMRIPYLRRTVFAKRMGQSLGNPITHPTVICVMRYLPDPVFQEGYQAVMDWDLWERLSRQRGEFVYVDRVLLCHRMSEDNTTAKLLETTNIRYEEEEKMLMRFWPRRIAGLIMKAYSGSAKYY